MITGPENLFEARYSDPVALGTGALFVAKHSHEEPLVLWRAPATGEPVPLHTLGDGFSAQQVAAARLGSRALFLVPGGRPGVGGPWASDGTTAGTSRLAELWITFAGNGGDDVGELGGRLFFAATDDLDGFGGFGLWATDGTQAGTFRVAEIYPSPTATPPGSFARLADRLLFAAHDDSGGRELWSTDGTTGGTARVADLVAGGVGSKPRFLTTVGSRVFFFAEDVDGAVGLWTTDGTASGTVRVAGVPGLEVFPVGVLKHGAAGGRFWFVVGAADRSDLWVSDGTPQGTGSLRPLLPETADVHGVWSAGDRVRVAMAVSTPFETTEELWETDGTLAGTRRLAVLPTSILSPSISDLAQAGSLLYFAGPHPEAGQELMALPLGPAEPCSADAETLCLGGGRFAVRARWRDPRTGDTGTAGALPLPGSDRTGLFWFFAPDNVELVVKNLAAGPVNGYFWNFYGALSDVEYEIEVTDTATGREVEYFNPGGEICGRGDTTAFPAREPVPLPVPAPAAAPVGSTAAGGQSGTACGGSADDLCLLGDRFRVEVEWHDQRSGDTGAGTAIPYADRSGFFWFFDDENVELVVKMLDGRQVNGRFWFFYGALSDVEYTITVTDTETDQQASYHNPPGEICGRGDTAAF